MFSYCNYYSILHSEKLRLRLGDLHKFAQHLMLKLVCGTSLDSGACALKPQDTLKTHSLEAMIIGSDDILLPVVGHPFREQCGTLCCGLSVRSLHQSWALHLRRNWMGWEEWGECVLGQGVMLAGPCPHPLHAFWQTSSLQDLEFSECFLWRLSLALPAVAGHKWQGVKAEPQPCER